MNALRWVVVVAVLGLSHCFDDWDQFYLAWSDEFDGNSIDGSKWQHEVTAAGGGNGEFQLYTQDSANSYVRNGNLYIRPSLLADNINPMTGQRFGEGFMSSGSLDVVAMYGVCTNSDNGGCYRSGLAGNIPPVMSARLRTYQRFSYTYGRAVIRAKMPVGDWMWPAIWMLPENWDYGGWPRSGEIDIIEAVSNRDYRDGAGNWLGIQKMGSTMHWGPRWDVNYWWLTTMSKVDAGNNYGDSFHTFYFDWSPNGIRFMVDDENRGFLDVPYPLIDQNPSWRDFWTWGGSVQAWPGDTSNPWTSGSHYAPFDRNFHFILNVAVGGTNGYIPDGGINRGGDPNLQKPWGNGDGYENSMRKFFDARNNWKWTWDQEGENSALQVDYVRVYKRINQD